MQYYKCPLCNRLTFSKYGVCCVHKTFYNTRAKQLYTLIQKTHNIIQINNLSEIKKCEIKKRDYIKKKCFIKSINEINNYNNYDFLNSKGEIVLDLC